ncbi:kunitz trypsin inhibitor 5-like [Primulina eburnea]|uniref:kunitz trypsin inhibitor 5-like n=1 Tax=Primulina eburnea TaxID=1245227 RepID=UPI003C6C3643
MIRKSEFTMKNLSSSFLIFLIFMHTTNHMITAEATQNLPAPAVLDLDGDKLKEGTQYYILPVIRGRGGGVTLSSRTNRTCPLYVSQAPSEVDNGLPLTFRPVDFNKGGVIRESTDLNIQFSAVSICIQSTVWKLDQYDELTRQYFITTGGVLGSPGPATISNWFKIGRNQSDYKLVFCPTVCSFCRVICRDVGIFVEDGNRLLALSDVPFRVMFKKA